MNSNTAKRDNTTYVGLKIDQKLLNAIDKKAKRECRSRSSMIRKMCEDDVKRS